MVVSLDGLSGADAGGGGLGRDGLGGSDVTAAGEAAPQEAGAGGAEDGAPPEAAPPAPDGATAADAGAADDGLDAAGASDAAAEAPPPPPITFVQIAVSTASTTAGSAIAKLGQAQSAGDLNVVAIGWNDATANIASVNDSSGNAYALAAGPTRYSPDLTQAIYYGKNIAAAAAGANSVTVTFVQPANMPDLRVLEYSGLDAASPLDQVISATGKGTGTVSTLAVDVAVPRELLFAAGMTTDIYTAPGSGYTERVVTSNGDLVEDRVVSAAGSYTGAAAMGTVSAEWVLQLATFR
jgi:hypothetical protein